tara:strand:+ start:1218 stop:1649 length:432 start_codon:yes stop_codon:yes gene_type:complete
MINPFEGMTPAVKKNGSGRLGNRAGILMSIVKQLKPNNRVEYMMSLYMNHVFLSVNGLAELQSANNLHVEVYFGEETIGLHFMDSNEATTREGWKVTTPSKTQAGRIQVDCTAQSNQEFFRDFKGEVEVIKCDGHNYLLKRRK